MNRQRLATILMIVILALGAAAFGFATGGWSQDHDKAVHCYEDQPCWDCHTMGNRRCGHE